MLPQPPTTDTDFDDPDEVEASSAQKTRGSKRVQRVDDDGLFEVLSGPDGDGKEQPTRRLTPEEAAILLRYLRMYNDTAIVRRELYWEYPDFPLISDRAIRERRKNLKAKARKLVKEVEADVVSLGAADMTTRLAMLNMGAMRAARAIVKKIDSGKTDPVTQQPISVEVWDRDASREMREYLKQIAIERGVDMRGGGEGVGRSGSPPAGPGNIPLDDPEGQANLEADQLYLNDMIAQMATEQRESDQAWVAATPPEGIPL